MRLALCRKVSSSYAIPSALLWDDPRDGNAVDPRVPDVGRCATLGRAEYNRRNGATKREGCREESNRVGRPLETPRCPSWKPVGAPEQRPWGGPRRDGPSLTR